MSVLKAMVRELLPPALANWIRQLQTKQISFEGEFPSWEKARARCTGYDAEEILVKVLDSSLKVKRGEAAFERDSVVFACIEYSYPLLSGLMWAAAKNGGRLNVLDFGGALGSTYFQNRKFLQMLPELGWNVVEQVHYVDAGRANIQEGPLRFYQTIEGCLKENQPNVVLLSSVLQYMKDPFDLIKKISCIGANALIVDRTPFSTYDKDKIVIQRVPSSIYDVSYPMWVFSQSKFMEMIDEDWSLVASTLSLDGRAQSISGLEFSFQYKLLGASF